MSDCSTEAMKPKAVDQCPYCGELTPFSGQLIDQQRKESKWVLGAESRHNTLEQRYQQLEQVAREMWSLIKNIEREYPRLLDPNRGLAPQTIRFPPSVEFAERLEEIGVSLDD